MALTKAHNRMIEGSVVNVRDFGAVGDGSTDDYAAIKAALDSVGTGSTDGVTLYFPIGNYYISQPLKIEKVGVQIVGENKEETFIQQITTGGFTGASLSTHPGTIWVNSSQCAIKNIFITGGRYTNSSDGIHITGGQFLHLNNVHVKFGERGIFLENGNSQRWFDVLVESCINGVVYIPTVTQDCNGGIISGLRCYNNQQWGFRLEEGDVSVINAGPRHNTIEVTSENNGQGGAGGGISIGRSSYNYLSLYAESQAAGDNYYIEPSNTANYMFVRNPDNVSRSVLGLFQPNSYNIGVYSSGGSLYFDAGFAEERYVEQEFTVSASLAGIGVKMYDVTNTSGSTRGMTLSFLSYSPVGFRTVITKRDNTAGFTLVAPSGITLTGDTGTFGASATSVKRLEVIKISSSEAILIQSGA